MLHFSMNQTNTEPPNSVHTELLEGICINVETIVNINMNLVIIFEGINAIHELKL